MILNEIHNYFSLILFNIYIQGVLLLLRCKVINKDKQAFCFPQ